MLYKMSVGADIPPLFVQLDKLEMDEHGEYFNWKERARWIRFEEQAEGVLGRWSNPHVATMPQTALDDLRRLLASPSSPLLLDATLGDVRELADAAANELIDYFADFEEAKTFAVLLLLPHHHHHETKVCRRFVFFFLFFGFQGQEISEWKQSA
jgi:hypothetical protein